MNVLIIDFCYATYRCSLALFVAAVGAVPSRILSSPVARMAVAFLPFSTVPRFFVRTWRMPAVWT